MCELPLFTCVMMYDHHDAWIHGYFTNKATRDVCYPNYKK